MESKVEKKMRIEEIIETPENECRAIVPINHYKRVYYQIMISFIDARLVKLKSMVTMENLLQIGSIVLSGAPILNVAQELVPFIHSFMTLNKWKRIYQNELRRLR